MRHEDARFTDAFHDPDGVWAWIGDQRATEQSHQRLPNGGILFDFKWTKFKKPLGNNPIELIYNHELLDISEPLSLGGVIGPTWDKKMVFNAYECHYVIYPEGAGEGW